MQSNRFGYRRVLTKYRYVKSISFHTIPFHSIQVEKVRHSKRVSNSLPIIICICIFEYQMQNNKSKNKRNENLNKNAIYRMNTETGWMRWCCCCCFRHRCTNCICTAKKNRPIQIILLDNFVYFLRTYVRPYRYHTTYPIYLYIFDKCVCLNVWVCELKTFTSLPAVWISCATHYPSIHPSIHR